MRSHNAVDQSHLRARGCTARTHIVVSVGFRVLSRCLPGSRQESLSRWSGFPSSGAALRRGRRTRHQDRAFNGFLIPLLEQYLDQLVRLKRVRFSSLGSWTRPTVDRWTPRAATTLPCRGVSRRWAGSSRITRSCCCLRRWSTQVLDWNQRILRAAEAGDPWGTDQGLPQARWIS
jgi:hypothetical protein